jgi:hypothetical protein
MRTSSLLYPILDMKHFIPLCVYVKFYEKRLKRVIVSSKLNAWWALYTRL